MTEFRCSSCNELVRMTNWDLIPSKFPQTYFCSACTAPNMLSRKTLLLCIGPSVLFVLAVAVMAHSWLTVGEALAAILAAYAAGLPLGVHLARRYGRLVAPLKPLL